MKSVAAQRKQSWEEAGQKLPPYLSTTGVANCFGVSHQCVLNWHKDRFLEADVLPSNARRSYRFPRQRVIDFSRANNLEINFSWLETNSAEPVSRRSVGN